ncbi:uncharacterized protein DFL_003724 [Arthrobotrys flagrans]|uniref:PD-(D/E)XK nuclease-like domain-containing protein n=1 Tax=Arthrobotrys flagrans TaxID=97331 RepID=A0A437A2R1_ARTFL|nr:hypothetical protein DFL_003724 [Arthrobotrys flagrans]
MNTSQVIEWMSGVTDTEPSMSHCPHQPPERTSPASENGEVPFQHSRKRKRYEGGMADYDDDLLLAAKSKRQVNQPSHPTPLTLSGFERAEPLYPTDSISQTDEVAPLPSRSSSPSKNVASTVGSKPRKREMLKQSFPKFHFLSASGRGGLGADEDPEDWVPASLQRLVSYLRGAPCLDEMVCRCVEDTIRERWPYEPWPKWNILKPECKGSRRHFQEAEFVIQTATTAEKMHSKMTEEVGWVSTTVQIMQFVAGFEKEFHPVSADPVTSVDVDRSMFPVVRNILPQNRSRSPMKKPRTSRSLASVTEEVLTARADLTVNFDLQSKKLKGIETKISQEFGGYPTPFIAMAESPFITVECKSQDGSNVGAEFQSTLCGSAMLESWRRFGSPNFVGIRVEAPDIPAESPPQISYPTVCRNIGFNDEAVNQSAGIDHVFALQVVSFMWSFTVIFIDPRNPADAEQSRRVLGPFSIGDSRTPTGLYAILRFLDKLYAYKVSVWLPGMLERGVA